MTFQRPQDPEAAAVLRSADDHRRRLIFDSQLEVAFVATDCEGRVTDWNGQTLRAEGDGRVLAVGDPALLPAVLAALGDDAAAD